MTKKTRADGEGSVYQQADGAWIAAISLTDPETGKRRQRRQRRATKKEALQALTDMRGRAGRGAPLRDSAATVASWSRQWERTVLPASGRRVTTQMTYRTLTKSMIRPGLGAVPLARLTPSQIEGWLVDLEGKGYAPATRQLAFTVLGLILKSAVREGLIAVNPAGVVARPKLYRKESRCFTAEQVGSLLSAAQGHRHRPFLVVLAATGARKGEIHALRWSHVDLEAGEIRIRGTLVRTAAGLVVHEPKTPAGWRTIPITAPVRQALAEQRQRQRLDRLAAGLSWIGSDFVFTNPAGLPTDPRTVAAWFAKLVADLGLTGSLHTLRHTGITSMLDAGVPMPTASRLAGHSSIAVTADLYGHTSDRSSREAVETIAAVLRL